MCDTSRLYGFKNLNLEEAKSLLESSLHVKLAPHDSYYHGGDYYLLDEEDVELILQLNFDCLDEDLAEPDFPNANVLLYVDGSQRANEIAALLLSHVPEADLLKGTLHTPTVGGGFASE